MAADRIKDADRAPGDTALAVLGLVFLPSVLSCRPALCRRAYIFIVWA